MKESKHKTIINLPVRINRIIPVYFTSIQVAYDAVTTGEEIQLQTTTYSENLYAMKSKSVSFIGGYDCDFIAASGMTTIHGDIIISNGFTVLKNIEIQQ